MELRDIYGLDNTLANDFQITPTGTPVEEKKVEDQNDMEVQDLEDSLNGQNSVVQGKPINQTEQPSVNMNLQKTEVNLGKHQKQLSNVNEESKTPAECTICYTNPVTILAYPCCHLCLCED